MKLDKSPVLHFIKPLGLVKFSGSRVHNHFTKLRSKIYLPFYVRQVVIDFEKRNDSARKIHVLVAVLFTSSQTTIVNGNYVISASLSHLCRTGCVVSMQLVRHSSEVSEVPVVIGIGNITCR